MSVPIFLFSQRKACLLELLHCVFCDRYTAGKAGRINSRHMDKAGGIGRFLNDKIALFLRGTDTCKGGNDLTEIDGGDTFCRKALHLRKALRCGIPTLRCCHLYSSRAGQQIAIYCGRNQDALAFFGRHLENGVTDTTALCFIQ